MDIVSYVMGRQTGIGKPIILTQPEDQYGAASTKAHYTIRVLGVGISYQWQYSDDGGANWANTSFTGNKTPAMDVTITDARNGYLYRCVITDENGTIITSREASLNVL